jgi:hypothetical protein
LWFMKVVREGGKSFLPDYKVIAGATQGSDARATRVSG